MWFCLKKTILLTIKDRELHWRKIRKKQTIYILELHNGDFYADPKNRQEIPPQKKTKKRKRRSLEGSHIRDVGQLRFFLPWFDDINTRQQQ